MSPLTHLLASWIVAAKTTDNPRDCRLVTLAGILPDADGVGLVVDFANQAFRHTEGFVNYQRYHHWYWHGLLGAILTAVALTCFARRRGRVVLLCLLTFHLHLLCDLVGSRGPSPGDLWPIFYLGPFSRHWMWIWSGQWRLDGWQNRVITLALFFWALWLASGRDDSVVGVFNRRADAVFTKVLKKWRLAWAGRKANADANEKS
jgi:inner membrane protein